MSADGGTAGEPSSPAVEDALAAGGDVREALRAYRARYWAAARELSGSEGAAAGFETLRADWERTVASFREAVDRIGTVHKTLARDR